MIHGNHRTVADDGHGGQIRALHNHGDQFEGMHKEREDKGRRELGRRREVGDKGGGFVEGGRRERKKERREEKRGA